ncbi:hypothetical protein Lesp02_61060 [Lentzea sp. NBRC 105346]|uniref:DUF6542 domain-containing protein n=1 Tax=Lentzea sp. NBRC 105346 TaxID=3032205 RepID=UPI0025529D37|nr:DUF6542 domain-containing protein [Lentzea sp. NBRC 105346]GLZ33918.1 hypothetical protein Lesp02_61060 [Lentzea sp. NBRC 105346]
MGVQIPSLAALAVMAVFAQVGIWVDGDNLGWPFGVWLVAGAIFAATTVRRIGLWVVAPAPPVVFVVLMAANTVWRQQDLWGSRRQFAGNTVPWLVHGFPWLAAAVGAGVLVAVMRGLRQLGEKRSADLR